MKRNLCNTDSCLSESFLVVSKIIHCRRTAQVSGIFIFMNCFPENWIGIISCRPCIGNGLTKHTDHLTEFLSTKAPVIITTVPNRQSTVIISPHNSTQQQPNFHPMVPQNAAGSMSQAYTGVPVQTFGFQNIPQHRPTAGDDKTLVENIVH